MALESLLSVRVERLDPVEFTNGAEPSNTVSQLSADWFSGDLLETLPAAVCVCDAVGTVVAYNRTSHRAMEPLSLGGRQRRNICGAP